MDPADSWRGKGRIEKSTVRVLFSLTEWRSPSRDSDGGWTRSRKRIRK
jgi:hypothetical protein